MEQSIESSILNRPVFAISSSILYILFEPSLSRNVIHCILKQETDSSFARSRYLPSPRAVLFPPLCTCCAPPPPLHARAAGWDFEMRGCAPGAGRGHGLDGGDAWRSDCGPTSNRADPTASGAAFESFLVPTGTSAFSPCISDSCTNQRPAAPEGFAISR